MPVHLQRTDEWTIIADDFTGAGDSSVQFRTEDLHVRLLLDPRSVEGRRKPLAATVVDTGSRFLSPEEAYDRVFGIADSLRARGARRFFKKIDSTWRGNPAEETDAVMAAAGYGFAVVASAAPKNGRIVKNGICHVAGIPLSETAAGKDPFTPVYDSRVARIMERRFPGSVQELHLDLVRSGREALEAGIALGLARGTRIFVADAESMDDLNAIAGISAPEGCLFVGSSGLAEALAHRSPITEFASPGIPQGQALFVIGSVTPVSRAQCSALMGTGHVEEIEADPHEILEHPAGESRRLIDLVRKASRHKALLVRTGEVLKDGHRGLTWKETGTMISDFLGAAALDIARMRRIRFLFASGGDSASKIACSLGAKYIDYSAELLPGVPFGHFRAETLGTKMYFASKAGGFGECNAMAASLALVTGNGDKRLERKERTI